jgi:hypothetical protein
VKHIIILAASTLALSPIAPLAARTRLAAAHEMVLTKTVCYAETADIRLLEAARPGEFYVLPIDDSRRKLLWMNGASTWPGLVSITRYRQMELSPRTPDR